MVKDEVWKQAGLGEGYLCIGCIEKRLGRQLNKADFTDAPINTIFKPLFSKRLLERMATEPLDGIT